MEGTIIHHIGSQILRRIRVHSPDIAGQTPEALDCRIRAQSDFSFAPSLQKEQFREVAFGILPVLQYGIEWNDLSIFHVIGPVAGERDLPRTVLKLLIGNVPDDRPSFKSHQQLPFPNPGSRGKPGCAIRRPGKRAFIERHPHDRSQGLIASRKFLELFGTQDALGPQSDLVRAIHIRAAINILDLFLRILVGKYIRCLGGCVQGFAFRRRARKRQPRIGKGHDLCSLHGRIVIIPERVVLNQKIGCNFPADPVLRHSGVRLRSLLLTRRLVCGPLRYRRSRIGCRCRCSHIRATAWRLRIAVSLLCLQLLHLGTRWRCTVICAVTATGGQQ